MNFEIFFCENELFWPELEKANLFGKKSLIQIFNTRAF